MLLAVRWVEGCGRCSLLPISNHPFHLVHHEPLYAMPYFGDESWLVTHHFDDEASIVVWIMVEQVAQVHAERDGDRTQCLGVWGERSKLEICDVCR